MDQNKNLKTLKQTNWVTETIEAIDNSDINFIKYVILPRIDLNSPLRDGETIMTYAFKVADQKLGEKLQAYLQFDKYHQYKCEKFAELKKNSDTISQKNNRHASLSMQMQRIKYPSADAAIRFSFEPLLKKMNVDPKNYPRLHITENEWQQLFAAYDELCNKSDTYQQSLNMFMLINQQNAASNEKNQNQILKDKLLKDETDMQGIFEKTENRLITVLDVKTVLDAPMTDREFMSVRNREEIKQGFSFLENFKPTPKEFLDIFVEEKPKDDGSNSDSGNMAEMDVEDDAQTGFQRTRKPSHDNHSHEEDRHQREQEDREQEDENKKRQDEEYTQQQIIRLHHSHYFTWQPERQTPALLQMLKECAQTIERQKIADRQHEIRSRQHGRGLSR